MEFFKQILVISRLTSYSLHVVQAGISLASKYQANLLILHLAAPSDYTMTENPSVLFPEAGRKKQKSSQQQTKEQLDACIQQELNADISIKVLISDRDPVPEIEKVVSREKIDLMVLSAHEEGRIEHALFGGENDSIIRMMPCSILLVKDEPGPVDW